MTGPGSTPSEQGADGRPPLQRAIPLRGLSSPDTPDPQPEDSGSWSAPRLPFWPAQPVPAATPAAPATFAAPTEPPGIRATSTHGELPTVADTPEASRDGAETTAGLLVPPEPATEAGPTAGTRPAPRPRLWLVPLILIGALVITAAAVAGRGLGPDRAHPPAAIPPATFGAPATGEVTIRTPSPESSTAAPSAGATPSSAAPSRTVPATPAPARTTAAAATPAPATQAPVASGPITGYSACTTGSAVVLAVTFTKPFDWHHAYIDVDGNASTGYDVPDISGRLGADYMVENDGFFRANDAEWDWSEIEDSGLQTARTGATFRWQVPRSALNPTTTPRIVFNGAGQTPDTNTPVLTATSC